MKEYAPIQAVCYYKTYSKAFVMLTVISECARDICYAAK